MSQGSSHFVGGIPESYDAGLGPNIFEGYASDVAAKVAKLKPSSVLELAAGTGILSRSLRSALPDDAELVITDLNAPMLDVAATKFHTAQRVRLQQADAMALPFDDDEFDLVVCQFGVMFFPDIPASYSEASRVARSGGHYLFTTWASHTENPFAAVARDVISDMFRGDPPGFYEVPFFYHDPDVVCADLASAGLQNVEHQELSRQRTVTDLAGFARGLVYGNPVVDEIITRGADPDDAVSLVLHGLVDRLGPEPATMPLKIHVFTCKIP
jgi:SAM-dependent methyltransferase